MKTIYVVIDEGVCDNFEVLASFSNEKDAQQFGIYHALTTKEACAYEEEEWETVDDFLEYWDIYIYPTKLDASSNPRIQELITKMSTLRCQLDILEREYHELMND